MIAPCVRALSNESVLMTKEVMHTPAVPSILDYCHAQGERYLNWCRISFPSKGFVQALYTS